MEDNKFYRIFALREPEIGLFCYGLEEVKTNLRLMLIVHSTQLILELQLFDSNMDISTATFKALNHIANKYGYLITELN